jgi:hypothetical protein|uniref:Uncharacterized protein n=1 Tax=viral metagenome TaxID=1070528 RepID=A0A6C0GZX0_9ZZZZ
MNENKDFSLGGFPPIYEVVSTIKKKEFQGSTILSIQSILSKRNMNRDITNKLNESKVNRIKNNK